MFPRRTQVSAPYCVRFKKHTSPGTRLDDLRGVQMGNIRNRFEAAVLRLRVRQV